MSNIWDKMLDRFISSKSKKQPVCDDFESFSQKNNKVEPNETTIKYEKLEKDITNLTVPIFTEEIEKTAYEEPVVENVKQPSTETTVNSVKIKKTENQHSEVTATNDGIISESTIEKSVATKEKAEKATKAIKEKTAKATKKAAGRPRKK